MATHSPRQPSDTVPSRPATCSPSPTTFHSILYRRVCRDVPTGKTKPPEHLHDLNIDQIVATVTMGRDQYDLRPFFYDPLSNVDDIRYRQQIMQDLDQAALLVRIPVIVIGHSGRR